MFASEIFKEVVQKTTILFMLNTSKEGTVCVNKIKENICKHNLNCTVM